MHRTIARAGLAAGGSAKGVCRTWIHPQPILFPCLLCSRSHGKGKPRQGECQELSCRGRAVPWLTALITDADPAAPGEHSKSLNMFVPCLSLQTAPAGRTFSRFIPGAKEKQLQEGAGCVRQLKPWFCCRAQRALPLTPGCSPGFCCTDVIPLWISCLSWSLAVLPLIKGVKFCSRLNSAAAAAKSFLSP